MDSFGERRQQAVATSTECQSASSGEDQAAYRKLLFDISVELGAEDIKNLAFMARLPAMKNPSALDLLQNLDRHGKIGQFKIGSLSKMLTDIHRSDLVTNQIKPFMQEKGERRNSDATWNRTTPSLISQSTTLPVFGSTEDILDELEPHNSSSSLIQQETFDHDPSGHGPPTSIPNLKFSRKLTPASQGSQCSSQGDYSIVYTTSSGYSGYELGQQNRSQHSQTASPPDLSFGESSLSAVEMTGDLQTSNMFTLCQHTSDSFIDNPTPADTFLHHSYSNGPLPRSPSEISNFPQPSQNILIRRSFTLPGSVPLQREEPLEAPLGSMERPIPVEHTHKVMALHSLLQDEENRAEQAALPIEESFLKELSGSVPFQGDNMLKTTQNRPHERFPATHEVLPPYSKMHKVVPNKLSGCAQNFSAETMATFVSVSEDQLPKLKRSDHYHSEESNPTPERCFTYSQTHEHEELLTSATTSEKDHKGTPGESSPDPGGRFKTKFGRQKCEQIKWSLKRSKLNKVIYEHKENYYFECKKKLEINVGSSFAKLTLRLYPYGLDGDRKKSATLDVHIDISKKAPPLSESAKIVLLLRVSDGDKDEDICNAGGREVELNLRVFRWNGVIAHDVLRDSTSHEINIELKIG